MQRSNQPDIKSLIIREAHAGDVPVLNRLFPDGRPDKHEKRVVAQQNRSHVYFLALQHGKPVGHVFLLLDGSQDRLIQEKMSRCPSIEDLYVDRLYQSRGIEIQLLEVCIERIKEKGYNKIGLSVGTDDTKNRQFYLKHGFLDSGIPDHLVEHITTDPTTGDQKIESQNCRYLIKHV